MGWDFCETKIIKKTRKPHNCAMCGRIIPTGSKNILHWYGKFDGEFQNSYACNYCEDHQDEFIDDYTQEIIGLDEVLWEIYGHEVKEYYPVSIKDEGDYFIFYAEETKEELIRVYCPIQRK